MFNVRKNSKYLLERDYIKLWFEWYVGNVGRIHYGRYITNNNCQIRSDLKPLRLPKLIVKKQHKFIMSELEVSDILREYMPYNAISEMVKGTLMLGNSLLLYLKNGNVIEEGYVDVSEDIKKPEYDLFIFSRLNYHFKKNKDGSETLVIKLNNGDKIIVDYDDNSQWVVRTVDKNNNVTSNDNYSIKPYDLLIFEKDIQYQKGAPCFVDGIEQMEEVEKKYLSLSIEFDLGRAKAIVDDKALDVKEKTYLDSEGNEQIRYEQFLNKDDIFFKYVNTPDNIEGKEKPMFEFVQPQLRVADHIQGINTDLSLISVLCGFNAGFITFDINKGLKTAREVISENTDTYHTIKNAQGILREFLINVAVKLGLDIKDIAISFGDSIFQDDESIKAEGLALFNAKAIDRYTLLVDYYSYSDQEAKEIISRLEAENDFINMNSFVV